MYPLVIVAHTRKYKGVAVFDLKGNYCVALVEGSKENVDTTFPS